MFAPWRNSRAWPIGCAVDDRELSVVQVQRAGGELRLIALRSPIDPGATPGTDAWRTAAATALRQTMTDATWQGRQVVTCLPTEQMRYRHLRLPPMPEAELPTAVAWRAARELGQSVEQLCTDYFDVGEALESGKQRHEVVAVTALQANVESHVATVEQAGTQVLAVDAGAAALARCLSGEVADEPRFIIDLGATGSRLMVILNGEPRFVRPVDVGRQMLIERAAEKADHGSTSQKLLRQLLTEPDASQAAGAAEVERARLALREACAELARDLAHEVTLCVHYINQARLSQLVPRMGCVLGGGAVAEDLMIAMNDAAQLSFRPAAELLGPRVEGLLQTLPHEDSPEPWLLPLGLALYGQEHVVREVAA